MNRAIVVQRHDDEPVASWTPEAFVDVGGCEVGITMDDGCYVVLAEQLPGVWVPTTHVPPEAAREIGRLAEEASVRRRRGRTEEGQG